MTSKYYFLRGANGETKGPFAPFEILQLAKQMLLPEDSHVTDDRGHSISVAEVTRMENHKSSLSSPRVSSPPPLPKPNNYFRPDQDTVSINSLLSRRVAWGVAALLIAKGAWNYFGAGNQPRDNPKTNRPYPSSRVNQAIRNSKTLPRVPDSKRTENSTQASRNE
jgi:hypothetical protein